MTRRALTERQLYAASRAPLLSHIEAPALANEGLRLSLSQGLEHFFPLGVLPLEPWGTAS